MDDPREPASAPERVAAHLAGRHDQHLGRAVGIPEAEVTIRGPREGFVESFETNLALLRRRICHSDLMIETY